MANNQTEAESAIQVQIQNLTAPVANPDESFSLPEFNLHHIFNFQSSSWNSFQLMSAGFMVTSALLEASQHASHA